MNKPKKIILGFLIVSLLIIALLYLVYSKQQNQNTESCNPQKYALKSNQLNYSNQIEFYYGTTCPHCKIVEQWIDDNKILNKININYLEVFNNKSNADKLIQLGKDCNLPSSYQGAVPLLYLNNSCYLGDKDIICLLKQETGVK